MAVYIELPKKLEPWQQLQDVLTFTTDEHMFAARLHIFDKRVLQGHPPVPELPPLSVVEYNELVDTVRAVKDFPIRPPLWMDIGIAEHVRAIADRPAPVQAAFHWKWYPWFVAEDLLEPTATDRTVTVAVAVLAEACAVGGFRHLLSLSQIWKMIPVETGYRDEASRERAVLAIL